MSRVDVIPQFKNATRDVTRDSDKALHPLISVCARATSGCSGESGWAARIVQVACERLVAGAGAGPGAATAGGNDIAPFRRAVVQRIVTRAIERKERKANRVCL